MTQSATNKTNEVSQEFLEQSDECVQDSEMMRYYDQKTKQCLMCNEITNGTGSTFLCTSKYHRYHYY